MKRQISSGWFSTKQLWRNGQVNSSRFRLEAGIIGNTLQNCLTFTNGQKRLLSDNLLGHNPMASSPIKTSANIKAQPAGPGAAGPSWGVDANTMGGGVWAQTSGRQSKLADLKLELKRDQGQLTLEDAATPEQKMDLNLVHGLNLIAKFTDQGWDLQSNSLKNLTTWLDNQGQLESRQDLLDSVTYVNFLKGVAQKSEVLLAKLDQGQEGSSKISAMLSIRDFYQPPKLDHTEEGNLEEELKKILEQPQETMQQYKVSHRFEECTERFRLLLVQKTASHLAESWDALTKLTDSDTDRAAVENIDISNRQQNMKISQAKVVQVIKAFATGSCTDRVEALWALRDHDNDGLLDQVEMDQVVELSIHPVKEALKVYATEVISSTPTRKTVEGYYNRIVTQSEVDDIIKQLPFLKRRQDAKIKKLLNKFMDRALANHFEMEVELPHRLRCVYAWADKKHQEGKIKSVLVDHSGADSSVSAFSGRKRYVELSPKIAYDEFRVEQKPFCDHLDRVGQEFLRSFGDEILLHQGQGRQNKDARREVMVFFAVLGFADVLIAFS